MKEKTGVWIARAADGSGVYPFDEEIDALRYAVDHQKEVVFVPWGEEACTYRQPPERPRKPAAMRSS